MLSNNLAEPRKRVDEDTILTLDPDTGKVLSSWGKGMFYMPHGLTIDGEGNTYVTDVGLHQVMRVCDIKLQFVNKLCIESINKAHVQVLIVIYRL